MKNYTLRKIEKLASELAHLLEDNKAAGFHWNTKENGIKAEEKFIEELLDLAFSADMTIETDLQKDEIFG